MVQISMVPDISRVCVFISFGWHAGACTVWDYGLLTSVRQGGYHISINLYMTSVAVTMPLESLSQEAYG